LDIPVCRCFRKRSHFKAETGRNPEVCYQTYFTRTSRRIFRNLKLRRDNASAGACLQKVNDSVPVIQSTETPVTPDQFNTLVGSIRTPLSLNGYKGYLSEITFNNRGVSSLQTEFTRNP
jgi:hypothetical protein